jgi:CRISPR-associated exonuclease Cas4
MVMRAQSGEGMESWAGSNHAAGAPTEEAVQGSERMESWAEAMEYQELRDLTVTDVRQWLYCPRVVYFTAALGARRPVTFKMEEGRRQHERREDLEARNSLRSYGLTEGEREFRVRLWSPRLRLSGILDMAIRTGAEAIPVDFKLTEGRVARNHIYQLTAYGMLLEERWRLPVRRGFIYLVPHRAACEVAITGARRRRVVAVLEEIRAALARESWPDPTPVRARHRDCEFLPRCGDVDVVPPSPYEAPLW